MGRRDAQLREKMPHVTVEPFAQLYLWKYPGMQMRVLMAAKIKILQEAFTFIAKFQMAARI